jgi:CBS domain containing-hemolysin-like protein
MKFIEKLIKRNCKNVIAEETLNELNIEEKDMIRGIVELSETTIKEVIVPRIDVVFISDEISEEELYKVLIETGHSRFPVYRETIDNVIGILYVKDLFTKIVVKEKIVINEIIRKPYFVPESMKLDSLLKEFKHRRVHIAIAVDEYGGVSGIVCMEDIIEEIVGDIQDEFDNEDEDIMSIGEGIYLCDARMNIEDFNGELGLDISDDDFDTLGGFVFDLFGKIPVRYEKVSFKNVDFIIQTVDGHKINTIKVVKKES